MTRDDVIIFMNLQKCVRARKSEGFLNRNAGVETLSAPTGLKTRGQARATSSWRHFRAFFPSGLLDDRTNAVTERGKSARHFFALRYSRREIKNIYRSCRTEYLRYRFSKFFRPEYLSDILNFRVLSG